MELYAHRDDAEARQAVDLFRNTTLRSPADGPVLDLACGTGRHAFELARHGYRVYAVDLSPTLLAAAHRKTRKYDGQLQLVRADMRQLPFAERSLSAVLQLFTAFGYFDSDAENAAVIRNAGALLSAGGWYLLDYLNEAQIRGNLIRHSEDMVGSYRVLQERRLTETRVEKRITVSRGAQVRSYTESVRLYDVEDFTAMFHAAGLAVRSVFGNYDGTPFGALSPRCIILAQVRS